MVNDPLADAAAAILRQHPGMDPGQAWRLALSDNPGAYHHSTPDGSQGGRGDLPALPSPEPASSPSGLPRGTVRGVEIARASYALADTPAAAVARGEQAPWAAHTHGMGGPRLADLACAFEFGYEPGRTTRRRHYNELSPAEKMIERAKMDAGAARGTSVRRFGADAAATFEVFS